MVEKIDVKMGEMAVGSGSKVIKTGGIGSCVVIVVYDKVNGIGGLAHAMLPSKGKATATIEGDDTMLAKYADEAVQYLVREVELLGAARSNLVAKLIGGSHMFTTFGNSEVSIGRRNVDRARETLTAMGVKIHGEEVGGTVGRIAEVNLENGVVSVETKM